MEKKRKYKRIIKRLSVKFGASDPNTIGFTSDVSPIGMFIRTNRSLPPETLIRISIETPSGGVIPLKGIVKRAIKYSSHLGTVMKNGMGVQLEYDEEGYLQFIQFIKDYYDSDDLKKDI